MNIWRLQKPSSNPPQMYGAVIGAKPDEARWDFMF